MYMPEIGKSNRGKIKLIVLILAIAVVFLFHISFGIAQKQGQARLDSLLKSSSEYFSEDTNRVNLLNTIAFEFRAVNPDKGMDFANQALSLAEKLKWKEGLAASYNSLGLMFYSKSDYLKAIDYYSLGLNIYVETGSKINMANSYGNIGNVYDKQSHYDKALDYFFKSLKITEELGIKENIAKNLNNIGIIYKKQSDYEKALQYYLQALKITEELGNKESIAKNLTNIGNVFMSQKKYDEALDYYTRAMKMAEELGNQSGIAINLGNIGSVYRERSNYAKALEFMFRAYYINERLKNKNSMANNLGNIGEVYLKLATDSIKRIPLEKNEYVFTNKTVDLNKAIEYSLKAVEIHTGLNALDPLIGWYSTISKAYDSLANYKQALFYYKKYTEVKDSVFSNENKLNIANLEARRETDLKQNQIELQQLELKNKENIIWLFISITAVVLAVLVIIILLYRNKQKTNLLLNEKNQIISDANIELETLNQDLIQKNSLIIKQNEDLEILNGQLQNAIHTKDKFFSIIAHDLKNPLQALMLSSDLLLHYSDKLDEDAKKEQFYKISRSSYNINGLLENLLEWSRSQRGIMSFDPQEVFINDLVKSAFSLLNNNAVKKNIEMVTEIDDKLAAVCDPNMIRTILRNLISNAIKFTNTNGSVIVKADIIPEENKVIISVDDNGIGIPENIQDKLFRIDVNISTPGTMQEQGTGLGLILCREFIEKHNGKLWVESKQGEGSSFKFTLSMN